MTFLLPTARRYDDTFATKRTEKGYMKKSSNGRNVQVVEGSYSYIAPNGRVSFSIVHSIWSIRNASIRND